jgi:hypothetical protein
LVNSGTLNDANASLSRAGITPIFDDLPYDSAIQKVIKYIEGLRLTTTLFAAVAAP